MLCVGAHRRVVVLRRRVDHQTTPEPWLVRQANRRRQRQVPPGAVARDDHLAIIRGQRVEVIDNPTRRGHGVLVGRGEGMLGGQPIVNRHDRAVGLMGEPQAKWVVGIEITDRPAPTMEVDDEWAVAGAVVHPRPERLLG